MRKDDFVLIDFYTQRRAIYDHTANWTPAELLEWIQQYGEIYKLSDDDFTYTQTREYVISPGYERYVFRPYCCRGLFSSFAIKDGKLVVEWIKDYRCPLRDID